jgi:transitional endoplasmic reticulum ATPase
MSTNVGTTDRNGFPDPPFWLACKSALMSGSTQAIILHLNTRDYALPGKFLVPFLTGRLATRDIVAIYNRSSGIRFPMPTMEQKAKDLLGLDKPSQPANPAFAALAAVTGNQSAPAFDWPKAPAAALALLEKLMLADARVTVILEYAETLLPAADLPMMSPDDRNLLVTLLRWGTDPALNAASNFAFLLVQNLTDLHPALRAGSSGYYAIEVPLPDRAARQNFIEWYLETQPIPSEIDPQQCANITAGLGLIHIENILLKAALAGSLTRDLVRNEKNQMIAQEYAGLVEVVDSTGGFNIVDGMDQIKDWSATEIIQPARENRLQDMPQGVILVGPPGTGKTYFIGALAWEIGFNAITLKMQNILGGIVGTSERNLARVLSMAKSLAPVLIFIDELDQSDISSRGNNSGNPVAKNLFSQILQFLGDPTNRGKIVFFGASNRPDLMDEALIRSGRIDAIIPVLLPEEHDRFEIARGTAERLGFVLTDPAAELIAANSEKYSAADVAQVVRKATKIAQRTAPGLETGHTSMITKAIAELAVKTIRPATPTKADFFTNLAIQACNDTELLPPRYAALLDDRGKLQETIQATEPAPARKGRDL